MIQAGRRISRDDVARHYDDLDLLYREIWGEHVHHGFWRTGAKSVEDAVIALLEEVVTHLGLQAGGRVLDAGCGYGATSAWIARTFDCDVVGVTVSERQHLHAMEAHAADSRLRFECCDILRFEADGPFDAILAVESVAHFTDKPAFFRLAAKALDPGGRLGLAAWLAASEPSELARRHLLQPICVEGRLPSLPTMAEYETLMLEAGFAVERAEDVSQHVRRTWLVIALRVAKRLVSDTATRALLFDERFESRVFAATVIRLLIAYYMGVMRYGILIGRKV